MRKFLLLLCAMLLLPAMAMAENKRLSITSSASVNATNTKPYSYRLIVPSSAVFDGTMTASDSYTVGAWVQLYGINYSTATIKEKGGTLLSFGTGKNCDYYGNWNISLATTVDPAKSPIKATLRGTSTDTNSADQVGFSAALPDFPYQSWIYVAVVVDNTNLKATVYYNDQPVHSVNLTAPLYYNGDDAIFSAGGLALSRLYIDELQFFNSALTAEEIKAAMIDATGIESIRSLYSFDEVSNKADFNNVLYNGNNTVASYCKSSGTTKVTAGEGIKSVTNTLNASSASIAASDRAVSLPVSIDPDLQNGTLVAKVNDEVLEMPGYVAAGTKVTLEATPAEGYQLVDYYAIAGGARQLLETPEYTVTKTTVFSATFTNTFYKLTVENPVNVPYTITLKGQEVTDLDNLVPGTVYKLALNVQDEAVLRNVQLDGKVLPAETDGSYLFSIEDAATLLINAEMRQQYTVTYPTYEQGVIKVTNAAGDEVASGSIVLEGNIVNIKASGNTGYSASLVKVNGNPVPNNAPYTVNRDIEITAEFVEGAENCVPTSEGPMTNTRTDNARGITKAEITDGESKIEISATGAYANGAFGTANGRKLYDADAAIPTITTKPGTTITITTTGSGEWMDTYVFFDQNINGLDTEDLVVSRGGGSKIYMADTYTFQIPNDTPTGMHRVRYINEWLSKTDGVPTTPANPCELPSSSGGDGAVVFDFDILVVADVLAEERTVSVATENEAYGSVAILKPETDGNSVTTNAHYVTVKATPAEGYSFLYWTDGNNAQVSVSPEFEYGGEADINLTAHFGHVVTYSLTGNGSMSVNDAAGQQVVSNQIVAVGEQLTFKFNPAAAHVVSTLNVNGVDRLADIKANEAVIAVTENLNIEVAFSEVLAHVSWVVRGNGTVTAGYEWDEDNLDATVDHINSGDALNKALFTANGGLTFFVYPGKADNGDDESIESATMQLGEDDAEDILATVEEGCDGGPEGDGVASNGNLVYYYTVSELPSSDVIFVFAFTNNGASSSIDDIFGDEEADAPAVYYNVNGVRVNGDNLTPGIYVVKKGSKTAKVMVM